MVLYTLNLIYITLNEKKPDTKDYIFSDFIYRNTKRAKLITIEVRKEVTFDWVLLA